MKTRQEPEGIDKLCLTKTQLRNGETPDLQAEFNMDLAGEKKGDYLDICRVCNGYNPHCRYYRRKE